MNGFDEIEIADRLPSPPGLCLALLNLANERREAPRTIVECLRADPALTGRLVRRANGRTGEGVALVSTARAAAAVLDPAAIRSVALSFSLPSKRPGEICATFDLRTHWLRSLACGAAAESLARRFDTVEPDEAFTLGLLCRVGLLAMATVHPAEFAVILREAGDDAPGVLEAAELGILQIDHWRAGADLMEAWGFPEAFLAPLLAFSRAAKGSTPAETGRQGSHALLSLALQMSEDVVAGTGSVAADGSAVSKAEFRSAREEAELRYRELVDLCGLRSIGEADPESPAVAVDLPEISRPVHGAAEASSKVPQAQAATRILVVDDDPGARHLLGLHLRRAGYEVISAVDGRAGLRAAVSESPQMVITDWLMPGLSGLELCQALRETEIGRHMYMILLTSREEEDNVVAGLEAGANDYLTKPFNARILLARVQAGERMIELQRQVEIDKLIDRKRVAQLSQITRKLRLVSLEDALTGLRNRRYAIDTLQNVWNASEKSGQKVSVVMIDIDHFKRVNDGHGHQAGDAVLRATADVLRASCRRSDTVCRLGGEEFLVITSNGAQNEALGCAERLRSAVEANAIRCGTFDGNVTISLGVAERTDAMESIDDLLAAADRAVYEAKAQGRNRACADEGRKRLRDSA